MDKIIKGKVARINMINFESTIKSNKYIAMYHYKYSEAMDIERKYYTIVIPCVLVVCLIYTPSGFGCIISVIYCITDIIHLKPEGSLAWLDHFFFFLIFGWRRNIEKKKKWSSYARLAQRCIYQANHEYTWYN